MSHTSSQPSPLILSSSTGRRWTEIEADFVQIPPGLTEAPGSDRHVLGIHFGPPVKASCCVGDIRVHSLQKPGDIGLIPAGANGAWEDEKPCQILRLSLRPSLLQRVAEDLGRDPAKLALIPRPQFRDHRIEAIGWAIKADLEEDDPSGPLYIDLLANALAVRMIEVGTASSVKANSNSGQRLSQRQLKELVDFIEASLDKKLLLADLARVAGVSMTRLKTLFRNSMGRPVHQYVVSRRIEYARALISTTRMPISQVALASGFAHQGHLTSTMRRILGLSPSAIARPQLENLTKTAKSGLNLHDAER